MENPFIIVSIISSNFFMILGSTGARQDAPDDECKLATQFYDTHSVAVPVGIIEWSYVLPSTNYTLELQKGCFACKDS